MENNPRLQQIPANTWFSLNTPVHAERDPIMIAENEIHVWRAYLDREDEEINVLRQNLSQDEKLRADQYHFPCDRTRFIVRRGLQRIILSYYLDLKPNHIQYTYNVYGKPELGFLPGDEKICFNTTHSSQIALYAITRNRAVGIDVERVVHDFPCEDIAESFFSISEKKQLLEFDQGISREAAFFTCWTRKEAYIKARGKGLSIPLDQFDVSIEAGEPAKLITNRLDPEEFSHWTLTDLKTFPGYVSTLAVEGSRVEISYREI